MAFGGWSSRFASSRRGSLPMRLAMNEQIAGVDETTEGHPRRHLCPTAWRVGEVDRRCESTARSGVGVEGVQLTAPCVLFVSHWL